MNIPTEFSASARSWCVEWPTVFVSDQLRGGRSTGVSLSLEELWPPPSLLVSQLKLDEQNDLLVRGQGSYLDIFWQPKRCVAILPLNSPNLKLLLRNKMIPLAEPCQNQWRFQSRVTIWIFASVQNSWVQTELWEMYRNATIDGT